MQKLLMITWLALGAGIFSTGAMGESAWFETEQDAIHGLSDGDSLPIFECTECDADNVRHRTTRAFIGHLLDELRAHGQPERGAFLLRERVQPRYYLSEHGPSHSTLGDGDEREEASSFEGLPGEPEALAQGEAPAGIETGVGRNAALATVDCDRNGWSPSLTRWDYDLVRNEARPRYSACLPFTHEPAPIRMSCQGCNLEALSQAPDIREQLKSAHWALFEGRNAVSSGVVIVTDSANRGFRRLDFRAYADTVYLGPADGDYYRISLERSAFAENAPAP